MLNDSFYRVVGKFVTDQEFRARVAENPDRALQGFALEKEERDALLRIQPEMASSWVTGVDRRIAPAVSLWYGDSMGPTISAIPNVGYTRISVHQMMLADEVRTEAFRKAVGQVVQPGDRVFDLGTGTGVLAFFAIAAGASHVTACEKEAVAEIAAELAHSNGLEDRLLLIHGRAEEVEIAQPIDVLISECIGSFGTNTRMIRSVFQIRDRFLKPGGKVIPSKIRLYAAPVEAIIHDWHLRWWLHSRYGLTWIASWKYVVNQMYTALFSPDWLLCPGKCFHTVDLLTDQNDDVDATLEFQSQRDGFFHGLAGWFEAELCSEVSIGTSPRDPITCWYQVFLPINEPSVIKSGDTITVKLRRVLEQKCIRWVWETELSTQGRVSRTLQDSANSYPRCYVSGTD